MRVGLHHVGRTETSRALAPRTSLKVLQSVTLLEAIRRSTSLTVWEFIERLVMLYYVHMYILCVPIISMVYLRHLVI